jgi:hypothetical protein
MKERRYALVGPVSGKLATRGGQVITHTNRWEMEFIFPGIKVVPVVIDPAEAVPLPALPEMCSTRFPVRRSDFHDPL